MEQQQTTVIESAKDIDPVIQSLQRETFGARIVFKARLSGHQHLDGKKAILLRQVMYPSDGEGGYDEEALPFFRLMFADGLEFDACESEIVTDDAAAERLMAAVCVVFGEARELGYVGPGHLSEEGTPEHGQAYIAKLRNLPPRRAQIRYGDD